MSQLNINLTAAFERDLKRYMQARGIATKSEAVRAAVQEALQAATRKPKVAIKDLLGVAVPADPSPKSKWLNKNDLWDNHARR